MMTSGSVLTFTFVFVLTFINTHCTLSNIDDFESPFNGLDLHDRDEVYDSHEIDARKPVREDGKLGGKLLETHHGGIGSLLLKNLRFRDVYYPQEATGSSEHRSTNNLNDDLRWLSALHNIPEYQRQYASEKLHHHSSGVSKRQVSVSELAEILNNLKARNVDNNVKLQSLRFGRK